MKKIIIRILTLLLVFLASVTITTMLLGRENTEDKEALDEPVLPEIMVDIEGTLTNCMYGYRQEMQVDYIRDSLTPIDTRREINLVIKPFGNSISGFSYEIRTSDGSQVLESQTVKNLTKSDSYLRGTISLSTENMKMNQEYSLRIQLDLEDGAVYYYTRILQRSGLNTSQYVEFVQDFYEKCLDSSGSSYISQYVEPDSSKSSSNFNTLDINSSLDSLTWGSLSPELSRQGIPMIREINETTGSVTIDYEITAIDDDGNTETYQVSDFYRMRYSQERVMLLDFQRTVNQVFDGNSSVMDSQGLNLGIGSKNVSYVNDESGDILAFVQNGDLWSYTHSASKLTRVFSFRRSGSSDERDANGNHDIKILRVQESGDIDFVLYGYMNSGSHEGYTGIAVYHYSSVQNAIQEQVFIPITTSYEFLKRDLEKLCYVNEDNQLYLMTGDRLYQIDIQGQSVEVLQDYIDQDCFFTSQDHARAAWLNEMEANGSVTLTEMDFETSRKKVLEAGDGRYIKIIGYMNEDLIYGYANQEDVVTDSSGDTVFAMNEIKIEDFDGTVKKTYQKEDMYITQVNLTDTVMEIQLSQKKGNAYKYSTSENIMNNKKAVEDKVEVNQQYTSRRGYIVRFTFDQSVTKPNPVTVTAKVKAMEHSNVMDVGLQPTQKETYYVYAYGKLDSIYTDPAEAVLRADEMAGVVLNRGQQYVWERGNKKTKIHLNEEDIPEGVLQAPLSPLTLGDALGDSAVVLDLTGCSLDSVLYEVSMQRPVVAATGSGESILIVGYDQYNILAYDPSTGETSYMGLEDSTALFKKAGNIFYTYIE